jgi:hypothetical protein
LPVRDQVGLSYGCREASTHLKLDVGEILGEDAVVERVAEFWIFTRQPVS